jgi:hypothetical protein
MEAVPPFASRPARATSASTKLLRCSILLLGIFLSGSLGHRKAPFLSWPFAFLLCRFHHFLQQPLGPVLKRA